MGEREASMEHGETILDLAAALFDLGGVEVGDFSPSVSTQHSPVYVRPRVLIGRPTMLRLVGRLINQEVRTAQAMRRPRIHPFEVVAGVPFGGLHLATAFALQADVPLVYVRLDQPAAPPEGSFMSGQAALIVDDLITSGTSIVRTVARLREAGLTVRDAIVLIDREQGAAENLRAHGIHLTSLLTLRKLLTYGVETARLAPVWLERAQAYLATHPAPLEPDASPNGNE
jgi:orotate phosphoribosyltransferase/uridine monophosphate synthetase